MCGLVCVISKLKGGLYPSDMKVFTELLYADQLRGRDGTGIFYNKKDTVKTLKAATPSSVFIEHELYDKAVSEALASANFMVGHNRAATKGKLTHQNTHPFRENHITLVHNGTLPYHKDIADVESDSMAIAISMAKIGAKETLKKINGAFAFIWTDSKQKTLNFVRNSQRPLYVISTKDLFVFVSEKELGQWICNRNNQFVLSTMEVPVNTLFQFEFGVWDKYETQKIDLYAPPPFVQHNNIVPYQGPQGTTKNGFKLGEYIKFKAIKVTNDVGVKLIAEYEAPSKELIEINYWCNDMAHANKLLKFDMLIGKISHEVYNANSKTTKLIVANVGAYEEPKLLKDGTITTQNKITLTKKEVADLDNRCSYCTGIFNKGLLHACVVTKKSDGEYSALCPDCTEWFNEEGSMNLHQYGV